MNEEMNNKDNIKQNEKNKKVIVLGIVFLLIVLITSAYAFFSYSRAINAFTLRANGITAKFNQGSNEIDFSNAYPISDEFALSNLNKLDYIDFSVSGKTSNPDEAITYELYLTEKEGNTLISDFVKVYLTDNNDNVIVGPVKYSSLTNTSYTKDSETGKMIYKNTVKGDFTSDPKNYKLYVWLDKDFSDNSQSRTFSFYVNLYAYNDTSEGIYTVTFDYNDGVTASTTKQVKYHENYGNLPTPTRDGYTFMGWNGKNLINDTEIRDYTNWKRDIVLNGDYPTNGGNPGFLLNLDVGKTYTISITLLGTDQSEIPPYLYLCKKLNNTGYLQSYLTTTEVVKLNYTFTVEDGETFFLRMGGTANEVQFHDNIAKLITIQLEQNSLSTEYEPYYITSSTKVVQNKDHTLKAIWKENN